MLQVNTLLIDSDCDTDKIILKRRSYNILEVVELLVLLAVELLELSAVEFFELSLIELYELSVVLKRGKF